MPVGAALRVATFNIRNGRALDGRNAWPLRRSSLLEVVRDIAPEVLALQEVFAFQRRWLERRLPDHDGHGRGRNRARGGEQCPVLVDRRRATVTDWRVRWFGPDPDRPGERLPGARFPRIATTCALSVQGWAETVEVTNVHLDAASAANRRASVEQLLGWLDLDRPQIVLGDLNAEPADEPLALLEAAGLRSVLPASAVGTDHQFSGRTDGPRIDHILVSDRIEVREAAVRPRPDLRPPPSDHWPVVADLALRSR